MWPVISEATGLQQFLCGVEVALRRRLERTLKSFHGTQQARSKHDKERAELLRWLLNSGHIVPLGAVNLKLESPLHCALHSASSEVIQVRITLGRKHYISPSDVFTYKAYDCCKSQLHSFV